MITGEPISLSACPPGAFLHGGTLGFKSEYGSVRSDDGGKSWRVTGAPDAYVIDSGEVFWGGVSTHAARDALIVRPVTLALPTPALDEGAAREPVEDLWQELCERDDRTSPEEYPEMCLITFDELSDFITRAHPSPPPAADQDRVRLAVEKLESIRLMRSDRPSGPYPKSYKGGFDAAADLMSGWATEALASLKSTAAKEGERS